MSVLGASACDTPPGSAQGISEAVFDIATRLGESERSVVQQIWRIVAYLGVPEVLRLVAATETIEAGEGMRLPDGTRRRTKGGVFFALVKRQLPPDVRAVLLPTARERKAARAAPGLGASSVDIPRVPSALRVPDAWAVRGVAVESAQRRPGHLTMLSATLHGRPGDVVEHPGYVAFELTPPPSPEAERSFQELKRLPQPSSIPPVPYLVYALPKHWRRVAEALKDPNDELIIEVAYMAWDEATHHLVVWAKRMMTRVQRDDRRRAQRARRAGGESAT